MPSLSARRAWIEILYLRRTPQQAEVALRKESVDRNDMVPYMVARFKMSLSARRAWIEINAAQATNADVASRSPQGERG